MAHEVLLQTYDYIKHNQPVTLSEIREVSQSKTWSIDNLLTAMEGNGLLLWEIGTYYDRRFGVLDMRGDNA